MGGWSHPIQGIRRNLMKLLFRGSPPRSLSTTQQYFVEWNAERLGIPVEESRRRYHESWSVLPSGHAGREYRLMTGILHRLYGVFSSDSPDEAFEAYRIHALTEFLSCLALPEAAWADDDPIVRSLASRTEVTLLDFGCGLAVESRSLAAMLIRRCVAVQLVLADIPTIRKEFLLWLGRRTGVPTEFLDCSEQTPIPRLPRAHACFATEFFEHVHDPPRYFEAFHEALVDGGFLVTNVKDHSSVFLHVSPDLEEVRRRLEKRGYEELRSWVLFRKPGGSSV